MYILGVMLCTQLQVNVCYMLSLELQMIALEMMHIGDLREYLHSLKQT